MTRRYVALSIHQDTEQLGLFSSRHLSGRSLTENHAAENHATEN